MRQFDRILRRVVTVVMLTGLVTVGSSTIIGVAMASTSPTCSALKLIGQTSMSSRPGGTTVRVTLTSRRFPTCEWSNQTGFQFLAADGRAAGPVVMATGLASGLAPRRVYDTFQIDDSIITMEGVRCSVLKASFIQVITPDRSSVKIPLPHTIGVCVGTWTKWTVANAPMFPVAVKCASPSIRLSFGPANGAAGTIYLPLRFTNIGTAACTIAGIPSAQSLSGAMLNSAHRDIGPRARSIDMSANGNGDPIRLIPGGVASAAFGVVETGNFSPAQCRAKTVQSLRVGLASGAGWWIRANYLVCTRLASTTIAGVVPSTDGVAPLS
jgi:hypothetical protein